MPVARTVISLSDMMKRSGKKYLFHVVGAIVVGFWLVMIGLMVRKIHFSESVVAQRDKTSRSIDSAEREWKEVFLKERKVGYAVSLIRALGEGYIIQEEVFLKLKLAGLESGIYTFTQTQVDGQFRTRSFSFLMTSGVVRFSVLGRVEKNQLVLSTGGGERSRTQRIKLNQVPMLGAGMEYFLRTKRMKVGESFSLPLFDPATMVQEESVIKVARKEALTLFNITYDAYRLETEAWGIPLVIWVDEKGVTLKEQGSMGLTLIRSSASRAPTNLEGDQEIDLYEISAVRSDRSLPDPARLSHLIVKIEGIDENPFVSMGMQGGRQHVERGILTVRKENDPPNAAYSLPHEYPAGMKPFLTPEFNIESDAPEIVRKAQEISGNEKDPVRVARKLLLWVYANLEKKPTITVPSALETLRTKVGDCNEHATLLTALLRASGIPARLSIGLVYTRKKFYYHAWTEAYVGTWISMDATLNQMPVDATHIKFLEGNLDRQMEMTKVMGELKLKILDFGHD
jgi:hypothetical protein